MISFLRGRLLEKGRGYLIVEVNNVGYQVFVPAAFYAEINKGEEAALYIHYHAREDGVSLYGFKSLAELEMFELLLTISGIGPKSALGVLSAAAVAEIKNSIVRGDSTLLTKVSGIGRKTAERVILELREKAGVLKGESGSAEEGGAAGEEIDALLALGYSLNQARLALRQVEPGLKDSSARLKAALRLLGK